MKDVRDSQTLDAFPAKKKRGRPATGNALTPLERKRAQLAKRRADFESANVPPYSECTTAYLLDYLSFLIERKISVPAKLVAAELAKRAL